MTFLSAKATRVSFAAMQHGIDEVLRVRQIKIIIETVLPC